MLYLVIFIADKYTVQECRRKWKNLRDTYHQYRLRKPKVGDGLSKWRYAKDLDFLSNVYQPKLKSHRLKYDQNFGIDAMTTQGSLTEMHPTHEQHDDEDDDGSGIVHNPDITLVSDDAETFILHAYEESVNDDVAIDHDNGGHDDGEMSVDIHDDNVEDVEEIVKQEHVISSLDEDGATGAEVDYEEVCMYEEAGNAPSVDSETIIATGSGIGGSSPNDSKAFQYINTTEFCIEPVTISSHSHIPCNNGSSSTGSNGGGLKQNIFKTISVLAPNPSSTSATTVATTAAITSTANVSGNCGTIFGGNNNLMQLQPAPAVPPPSPQALTQTRDELDLFFDFLKNKMQRLPQVDITGIQIEFLNCVLRREADAVQKSTQ